MPSALQHRRSDLVTSVSKQANLYVGVTPAWTASVEPLQKDERSEQKNRNASDTSRGSAARLKVFASCTPSCQLLQSNGELQQAHTEVVEAGSRRLVSIKGRIVAASETHLSGPRE